MSISLTISRHAVHFVYELNVPLTFEIDQCGQCFIFVLYCNLS